ncbi:hypothetical protein [Chitinibacter sp. S2-10]|uniref:lipid-binding SYLF domain-containing protein n=1 Tax=Chitinibacter sp. S2-10 TaxID=3373597 RepID=UPI0039774EC1
MFKSLGLIALLTLTIGSACAVDSVDKQRSEIRSKTQTILSELYRATPSAKAAVKSGVGYAVFSNKGMKILVAGGGTGSGMAVHNGSKQETFMKMLEVQAGLGMGIKSFRVIFVFETESAFNSFVNSGWTFSGQTTAAAKSGDKGMTYQGAVSVTPGVWMYQLTDKGLALEMTGKGTKYYKNDELN